MRSSATNHAWIQAWRASPTREVSVAVAPDVGGTNEVIRMRASSEFHPEAERQIGLSDGGETEGLFAAGEARTGARKSGSTEIVTRIWHVSSTPAALVKVRRLFAYAQAAASEFHPETERQVVFRNAAFADGAVIQDEGGTSVREDE